MAEIAGLVLAVAGLAGTFTAILEFSAKCRNDGNPKFDTGFFDIKLKLQHQAFEKWATAVGLNESITPGEWKWHDTRLDDPEMNKTVEKTLRCIQVHFQSAFTVGKKYPGDMQEGTPVPDIVAFRPGQGPPPRIDAKAERRTAYRKFKDFLRKMTWMYGDKEKVNRCIDNIAGMLTDLRELIEPPTEHARAMMASVGGKDIESVTSEDVLKVFLEEGIRIQNTGMIDAARRGLVLSHMKQWLKGIDTRRARIAVAHRDTFEWALAEKTNLNRPDAPKWDHLPTWLRSDSSGIYWVSGKAGSGKSTLMKYLLERLERPAFPPIFQWARGSEVTVCNFFFENLSRDADQKTLAGLARSLVYQILCHHSHLIDKAFPQMWADLGHNSKLTMPTTIDQMFLAIQEVAKYARGSSPYFCFLIDGLDEFVSTEKEAHMIKKDAQRLMELIASLSTLPRVKMLISSRPTPDCLENFNKYPKLRIQDHTKTDIDKYIKSTLGGHDRFPVLMKESPDDITALLDDMASRASGIFLWVRLACQSLMHGLKGHANINELRRRVNLLPKELGEMFWLMLTSTTDEDDQMQAARLLRFCRDFHDTKMLDCRVLGFTDSGADYYEWESGSATEITEPEIMALTLARLDNSEFLSVDQNRVHSDKRQDALIARLEERLRQQCGGLLEVQNENGLKGYDDEAPRQVVFIHRSVHEFLNTERQNEKLRVYLERAGSDFHLEWTRTLYWIQRIPDIYDGVVPYVKQLGSPGAKIWLPIVNSRIWNMKGHPHYNIVLAQLRELLNEAPDDLANRPRDYGVEISAQWLKTAACCHADRDVVLSCLRTTLSLLAPNPSNPTQGFDNDGSLEELMAHHRKYGCSCPPPLVFATDNLAVSLFNNIKDKGLEQATAMAELVNNLAQRGAKFNDPATIYYGKSGGSITTTPWKHFVRLFKEYDEEGARSEITNYEISWHEVKFTDLVLDTVEDFLDHGAHVTVQDLDDIFSEEFSAEHLCEKPGQYPDDTGDDEAEDEDEDEEVATSPPSTPSPTYHLGSSNHYTGPASSPGPGSSPGGIVEKVRDMKINRAPPIDEDTISARYYRLRAQVKEKAFHEVCAELARDIAEHARVPKRPEPPLNAMELNGQGRSSQRQRLTNDQEQQDTMMTM